MKAAIVETVNVESFFHPSVHDAVASQKLDVCDETIVYMTQLLTRFVRSDRLFEDSEDGVQIKPLALLYCDAAQAQDLRARCEHLRRLGDLALFISGWFEHNLERRRVGVRYYIEMGECAYDSLSEYHGDTIRGRVFTQIFQELAVHFRALRDVIAEIHMNVDKRSDADLLALYELWHRSGSARAEALLRAEGIDVVPGSDTRH